MKCHCGALLQDHDDFAPKSGGGLHCFGCGCCFRLDGKTPREGVMMCAAFSNPVPAQGSVDPVTPSATEASEAPAVPEPEKPVRRSRTS